MTKPITTEQIAALYGIGLTLAQVGERVGMTGAGVARRLRRAGFPRRKSNHGRAPEISDRDREIVAAYRDLGTLEAVGAQFGVTRERIRQIVSKYERLTGETVPRTGYSINSARWIAARPIWRCAGCGIEQRRPAFRAKHKCCRACRGRERRKILSDRLIERTIARVLAGETFHSIAMEAGYSQTASHVLKGGVYAHLRRQGDVETIDRLWPNGLPNWLRKRHGEPPQRGRAA